jgi:hypothetical protein
MIKNIGLFIAFCWFCVLFPESAYAIGFTAAAAAASAGIISAGTAAVVGTGITAATIGLGAYAASQMFKKPKTPSISQQTQPLKDAEPSLKKAELEAKMEVDKRRRAVSRNKSIYTGPLGLTEADKSDISLKTLTGV